MQTALEMPLDAYLGLVEGQLDIQRGCTLATLDTRSRAVVGECTQQILWHYLDTIRDCKTGNCPPAIAAERILALHWEAIFKNPDYLREPPTKN